MANARILTSGPYDFAAAMELYDHDSDLLLMMLDKFQKKAQAPVEKLSKQSITDADMDEIRLEAHSIVGAASYVQLTDVMGLAKKIELDCKERFKEGRGGCAALQEQVDALVGLYESARNWWSDHGDEVRPLLTKLSEEYEEAGEAKEGKA